MNFRSKTIKNLAADMTSDSLNRNTNAHVHARVGVSKFTEFNLTSPDLSILDAARRLRRVEPMRHPASRAYWCTKRMKRSRSALKRFYVCARVLLYETLVAGKPRIITGAPAQSRHSGLRSASLRFLWTRKIGILGHR
jgi:hypothetical protein